MLTIAELKALNAKLHLAAVDPSKLCRTKYQSEDGKDYRLVAKPRGRLQILQKYGHDAFFDKEEQVVMVKVPLGVHGSDHLVIDPNTGEIVCSLCHGKEIPESARGEIRFRDHPDKMLQDVAVARVQMEAK